MKLEKSINMDMLRRCNQALDNSQDLINFYHKLSQKVEKQESRPKKKEGGSALASTKGFLSSIAQSTASATKGAFASITPDKQKGGKESDAPKGLNTSVINTSVDTSIDQSQEPKEITFVNPTQIFKFCQSVRTHLIHLDSAEGCTS